MKKKTREKNKNICERSKRHEECSDITCRRAFIPFHAGVINSQHTHKSCVCALFQAPKQGAQDAIVSSSQCVKQARKPRAPQELTQLHTTIHGGASAGQQSVREGNLGEKSLRANTTMPLE